MESKFGQQEFFNFNPPRKITFWYSLAPAISRARRWKFIPSFLNTEDNSDS